MCYQLNGFEQTQHHLLGAHGSELLKRARLKRNVRRFFWTSIFILQPGFSSLCLYQAKNSPHLSSRPISNDPQARCYPPNSSQEWRLFPRVEITPCNLTQPLAATPLPAEAAEICLWHREGGLLMLLPSRRAFMPDLWQLDKLSGLTEASLRTGPPSDRIIPPARIVSRVPNPAKLGRLRLGSSQSKVKGMFHHGQV